MEVKLVVLVGKAKGREIPLPASQFIIGRGQKCHLRPHSETVSKLHCAIGRSAGYVIVRDLKSSNKTYINDEPINGTVRVNDGDVLGVGPLRFRFAISKSEENVVPKPIREDHFSWLMEASDSFEMDSGGETTVVEIPPHLLDDDVEEDEPAGQAVAESADDSEPDLSAGKYLHEYFHPRKPGANGE